MNKNTPLVSVLMSVKDDEKNISNAIESILNQSFTDFEFLILNDYSQDSTPEIINKYKKEDERIQIFTNPENLGLTKSLNKLIDLSSGRYIARQDSDDISMKDRLHEQIKFIMSSNFDACTTRAVIRGSTRAIPNLSFYIPKKISIKYKNPFIHGTLLIKKQVLIDIGKYDENFYYSQDYKLFKDLISRKYKIKTLNKKLYKLNMENNISNINSEEQKYYSDCVKRNIKPAQ